VEAPRPSRHVGRFLKRRLAVCICPLQSDVVFRDAAPAPERRDLHIVALHDRDG
jgi:hypothetical protein